MSPFNNGPLCQHKKHIKNQDAKHIKRTFFEVFFFAIFFNENKRIPRSVHGQLNFSLKTLRNCNLKVFKFI